MTKAAIISAEFCDFRMIKTRNVAQIICEVPIEELPGVMETLGWPQPSSGIPIAIAKLMLGAQAQDDEQDDSGPNDREPESLATSTVTPDRAGSPLQQTEEDSDTQVRRHFRDLPRSQQAALKCDDPEFQKWLLETNPRAFLHCDPAWNERARCDWALKLSIVISSKKDLDELPEKAADWDKLLTSFQYRDQVKA